MHRLLVLSLAVLLVLAMVACGDSSNLQIKSIAYVHVPASAPSSALLMRSGEARPRVSGNQYTIMTMDLDGTNQKTIFTSSDYIMGADLSRDAKKIAYVGYDPATDYDQVFILDVATKEPKKLTSSLEYKYDTMLTPDGKNVIYRAYTGTYGAQLWSVPTAGGTEKAITTSDSICIHEPHVTLDGKQVVFEFHTSSSYGVLGMVNIDGSGYKAVANTTEMYAPALSSDKKSVYYVIWDSEPQIYVANADGTSPKAIITQGYSVDPYPVGSKVMFSWDPSSQHQNLDIYSMNPDGTGQTKLTNGGVNYMHWIGD